MSTPTLTLAQARRIAVHAQGLARGSAQPRPAVATMRQVQGVIDRLGLLQIDSVNVLARAHLLPLFSRLGDYDVGLLDRASRGTPSRPRRVVEYWAHVAAYVPPRTYGLLRYRMAAYRAHGWQVRREHPEVVAQVAEMVAEHGPITASTMHELLGHERSPKEHWGWNWSLAKQALELGYFTGALAVAHRTAQFERAYDLPERVLPASVLAEPALTAEQAAPELVEIAARALGIGTVRCFADYFRMRNEQASAGVAALVARGVLEPVAVTGWPRTLYMHAEAARPRRTRARALLAPFDPMVFERRRLLELFGMHYRIGIYTPPAQRTDGYYVLPFLLGESFVGRVDLKADRGSGTLRVKTAFLEEGAPDADHVATELALELAECAQWRGLGRIDLADDARGDLVQPLRAVLNRTG